MFNFAQETYEDDNGRPIKSSDIRYVAPFIYHADGFFGWGCHCGYQNVGRAHKINGVVFVCSQCLTGSLLLRSDCDGLLNLHIKLRSVENMIAELKKTTEKASAGVEMVESILKALKETQL